MEEARMANSNLEMMKRGGQAIDDMAERTGQGASLADQGLDMAEQATRAMQEQARGAASAASGAYETAADTAGRAYGQAREMASEAYDHASQMARQTGRAVQRGMSDFEGQVGAQTERHPLLVLGLAAGIGFLIGAWFSSQGRASD
jgi:ElaB/YqjD/DUF883 family membrane-anchored ribosome-binding protein